MGKLVVSHAAATGMAGNMPWVLPPLTRFSCRHA
jgi:hypothetical protein